MLLRLSGRTHEVLSGVAVRWKDDIQFEVSTSSVTFPTLDAAAIARYVATGEPLDKAGGYAIQGRAAAFIRRLEGSYSGVMGLPLSETAAMLASLGVPVL
jgi:septum formation protein